MLGYGRICFFKAGGCIYELKQELETRLVTVEELDHDTANLQDEVLDKRNVIGYGRSWISLKSSGKITYRVLV